MSEPYIPAATRVVNDEWRRQKERFYAEVLRRRAARGR